MVLTGVLVTRGHITQRGKSSVSDSYIAAGCQVCRWRILWHRFESFFSLSPVLQTPTPADCAVFLHIPNPLALFHGFGPSKRTLVRTALFSCKVEWYCRSRLWKSHEVKPFAGKHSTSRSYKYTRRKQDRPLSQPPCLLNRPRSLCRQTQPSMEMIHSSMPSA